MMDEDDDVLDLGAGDAGVDEPMGGAASAPAAAEGEPKLPAGPTETELRLARRVMELEKERDEFQAQLQIARPPPPVVLQPGNGPITVPNELMPVLAMLQQHIADLTRDNETLRYLFYGESRLQQAESSLSKVSLQSPDAAADADTDADHEVGHRRDATRDIDLDGLLSRVKEVMRENEELGELLLEAGERGSVQQWERALEESKAVITSLDADLTHHLGVIESLRAELVAVKAQQAGTKYREPESSSSRQDRPRNRESQQRGPGRTGPGDRHKETSRDRDRDKGSRSHVDRPRDSVHHPDARRHGPPTGPRGSTPQRADAGPPPSQTQPQAKQPMQLSVKGRAGSGGGIMSGIAGGVPRGGAQANGAAQAHSRADSTEGDRDSKRRR